MKATLLAFVALFAFQVPTSISAKPAPAARDWSRTVVATPEGGFRMGNPSAKVKLVEYGSLTCPHCRAFDQDGAPTLINSYVKSGKLSWEFRNYVRDALDMSAVLVARCGGPKSFYPIARALFDDQPAWTAKVQDAPAATIERLQGLPKDKMFLEAAKLAGLQAYASAKGVNAAQTTKCLTDMASVDRLAAMTGKVKDDYPDFAGTPTFILNGKLQAGVYDWKSLQPALKAAVGR